MARTYVFQVDGSVVDTQVVCTGDELLQPESPAKEGHKFMGWSPDGGASYFTSFGVQTVTEGGTVVLEAIFEEVYYVFFLDADGRVYETREGVSGDTVYTDVEIPVNADESVTGWYTEETLENRVDSVVLGEENVTLWPKVEKGNWLVFDSQGGSYIEPAFYAPGQMTAAPAAPAKLGYEFAGWYTDASLTEEYVFGGELTAGTTVYAKWTPSTAGYTILYWTENADDENYSYVGSRDVTGATVGETIVLTSSQTSTNNLDSSYRQYFTYERSDEGRQVSGDGSTIVNVYYARKTYTLTFRERTSGGWWGSGSYETVATITAKYDAYIAEEFEKAPFSTTYAGRAWEATSYYSYALQTLDRMPGRT